MRIIALVAALVLIPMAAAAQIPPFPNLPDTTAVVDTDQVMLYRASEADPVQRYRRMALSVLLANTGGGGGTADGVLSGITFATDGVLSATITGGTDFTSDISTNLGTFVNARRGGRTLFSTTTIYTQATDLLAFAVTHAVREGDVILFIAPSTIGSDTSNITARTVAAGSVDQTAPLVDLDGSGVSADELVANRAYELIFQDSRFKFLVPLSAGRVLTQTQATNTASTVAGLVTGQRLAQAGTPLIASFARQASPSGIIPRARLCTGTAGNTDYCAGSGQWTTIPSGGGSLSAYTSTPAAVGTTGATAGTSGNYARGDHAHQIADAVRTRLLPTGAANNQIPVWDGSASQWGLVALPSPGGGGSADGVVASGTWDGATGTLRLVRTNSLSDVTVTGMPRGNVSTTADITGDGLSGTPLGIAAGIARDTELATANSGTPLGTDTAIERLLVRGTQYGFPFVQTAGLSITGTGRLSLQMGRGQYQPITTAGDTQTVPLGVVTDSNSSRPASATTLNYLVWRPQSRELLETIKHFGTLRTVTWVVLEAGYDFGSSNTYRGTEVESYRIPTPNAEGDVWFLRAQNHWVRYGSDGHWQSYTPPNWLGGFAYEADAERDVTAANQIAAFANAAGQDFPHRVSTFTAATPDSYQYLAYTTADYDAAHWAREGREIQSAADTTSTTPVRATLDSDGNYELDVQNNLLPGFAVYDEGAASPLTPRPVGLRFVGAGVTCTQGTSNINQCSITGGGGGSDGVITGLDLSLNAAGVLTATATASSGGPYTDTQALEDIPIDIEGLGSLGASGLVDTDDVIINVSGNNFKTQLGELHDWLETEIGDNDRLLPTGCTSDQIAEYTGTVWACIDTPSGGGTPINPTDHSTLEAIYFRSPVDATMTLVEVNSTLINWDKAPAEGSLTPADPIPSDLEEVAFVTGTAHYTVDGTSTDLHNRVWIEVDRSSSDRTYQGKMIRWGPAYGSATVEYELTWASHSNTTGARYVTTGTVAHRPSDGETAAWNLERVGQDDVPLLGALPWFWHRDVPSGGGGSAFSIASLMDEASTVAADMLPFGDVSESNANRRTSVANWMTARAGYGIVRDGDQYRLSGPELAAIPSSEGLQSTDCVLIRNDSDSGDPVECMTMPNLMVEIAGGTANNGLVASGNGLFPRWSEFPPITTLDDAQVIGIGRSVGQTGENVARITVGSFLDTAFPSAAGFKRNGAVMSMNRRVYTSGITYSGTNNAEITIADTGYTPATGDVILFQHNTGTPANYSSTDTLRFSVGGESDIRTRINDSGTLRDIRLNDLVRYEWMALVRAGTFWHLIFRTYQL